MNATTCPSAAMSSAATTAPRVATIHPRPSIQPWAREDWSVFGSKACTSSGSGFVLFTVSASLHPFGIPEAGRIDHPQAPLLDELTQVRVVAQLEPLPLAVVSDQYNRQRVDHGPRLHVCLHALPRGHELQDPFSVLGRSRHLFPGPVQLRRPSLPVVTTGRGPSPGLGGRCRRGASRRRGRTAPRTRSTRTRATSISPTRTSTPEG